MDWLNDPLEHWLTDHNRLLTLYTCFYAWQRRITLIKTLHTWMHRMFTYRMFRNSIPHIRMGNHYMTEHMQLQLNRRHDLPDRDHYIRIIMDYSNQIINQIPADQIIYHPTPSLNIIVDMVEHRYAVLPYTHTRFLNRERHTRLTHIRN